MNFNAEHLTQAFELMALGMGGVFLVLEFYMPFLLTFIKSIPRQNKEAVPWKTSFSNDYGSIAIKSTPRLGMVNGSS